MCHCIRVDGFRQAIDERGECLSVLGLSTLVLAQFDERKQLEPRCLLGTCFFDRPSDRDKSGRQLATRPSECTFDKEELR